MPQTAMPAPSTSIAIVGMSVDFPGAPDKDALWDVLQDGINTVTKVRPQTPSTWISLTLYLDPHGTVRCIRLRT